MKKKLITIACVCFTLISSCQNDNMVKLTGEIENGKDALLEIVNNRLSDQTDITIVIDGVFSKDLEIEKPVFKTIAYGYWYQDIFLAPGYSLHFTFDMKNVNSTLKISGKGSAENRIFDSINNLLDGIDYDYIYNRPVLVVAHFIDSIFIPIKHTFDQLISSGNIEPLFVEYGTAFLTYRNAVLKMSMGLSHQETDSDYYSFLKDIKIEDENYLDIPSYRTFLDYYVEYQRNQIIAQDTSVEYDGDKYLSGHLKAIETIQNKNIYEYQIYESIKNYLRYYGADRSADYIKYFNEHNTDPVYSKRMNELYEKKSLLASGKPAPLFSCRDIDSNLISLSDFRNKFVYVDFWATWCGPCMQELPYYIKLQSEYKDKNIVFISISLDDDKSQWKKMITEEKSDAINLFGGNGWDSEVSKSYQVYAIPTFVLIDTEGKIIAAQAPRPSSDEIRKKLDDLLDKGKSGI